MRVIINYKPFSDAEYICCAETEIMGERHFGIGKDWEGARAHLLKKLDGVLGQSVPPPETVEIKVAGEDMDTELLPWEDAPARNIEAGKV